MRAALFALLLCLPIILSHGPASAQTPGAYSNPAHLAPDVEAATRRLVSIMRIAETSRDMMQTQMSELVQMLEASENRMPDRAIDIVVEEMQKVGPQAIDQIIDAVVVLYAGRFTKAEMLEMTAFYKTPVGQKAIRELRPLMQEAATIGQSIGQRLGQDAGQRAFSRIQAEGIKLPRR